MSTPRIPPPPPPFEGSPPQPLPRTGGIRRWQVAGALALSAIVVAAAVITTVLVLDQDRSPEGMLAATFPDRPAESWRAMPEQSDGTKFNDPNFLVGGDIPEGFIDAGEVVVTAAGGAEPVVGIDKETGGIRWRSGPVGSTTTDGCSGPLFGDRIACLSNSGTENGSAFTFIALDDGRVLSHHEHSAGYYGVVQVGKTLVYSGQDDTGRAIMTGGTEDDPEKFWKVAGPAREGTRIVRTASHGIAIFQDVSVTGGFTMAADESGTLLAENSSGYSQVLPNGLLATYEADTDTTVVVDSGRNPRYSLPGMLVVPRLTVPGEASAVGFIDGEAYDLADGSPLWRSSVYSGSGEFAEVPAQIGAVVVHETLEDRMVGVSAVDGSVLWDRTASIGWSLETDGAVLITQSEGRLVAYRITDGTLAWETDVVDPDNMFRLGRSGDHLVVATTEYVAGFAPTGPPSRTPSAEPPTPTTIPDFPQPLADMQATEPCAETHRTPLSFGTGVGSSTVTVRTRSGCDR